MAALVEPLLASSPGLRVLTTSREVLGVAGEAEYPVPPLSVPESTDEPDAIRASEAVRLFLARARDVRPGIGDDDATLATVGRICADLDGLPLAMELAAARAGPLRRRHRWPTTRSVPLSRVVAPARHGAASDAAGGHGLELRPPGPRRAAALAELSVFTGGFTLDAVQDVGTGAAADRALELIERLAEASLVIVDKAFEPTRYRVLETVRQYGAERLESAGRTEALRERHSRHFAAYAEVARLPLRSSGSQADWVKRLDPDRDNFRAALTWSLDRGEHDRALRIAEALWWYLWIHGGLSEGRVWLERSLAGATTSEPLLRARGMRGLAGLTWALGDYAAAEPAAEEAMRLSDELGDNHQGGSARNTLGLLAEARGDFLRARDLYEAAIEKYRASDLEPGFRQRNLGITIDNLGSLAHNLGDDAEARRRYQEARAINFELGDQGGIAMNDLHLAILDAEAGAWSDARQRFADALALYRRVDFLHYAAECLEGIATVANGLAAPREAAFVLGASTHIRGQVGNPPVTFMVRLREREEAAARAALGAADYDAALAEGLAAPIDVALERALRFLAEPPAAPER